MLCKRTFMKRCEIEAWKIPRRSGFSRGQSKFGGLYFAVVALGAINASSQETPLLDHYCGGYTSLEFADFYFGIAKQALGDIFESSSIESAQALLLMVGTLPLDTLETLILMEVSSACFVKTPYALIVASCIAVQLLGRRLPLG